MSGGTANEIAGAGGSGDERVIMPNTDRPPYEERVHEELRTLRSHVQGVHGGLVATSDGFLIAQDIPALEPTRIAALIATTLGLARQATYVTGRGDFREAVIRGSEGYLAVFSAGDYAVLSVLGTNDLNIGMLHYQARGTIARIAAYSAESGGAALTE